MRVEHEICSTICGTPVRFILDHKNLTDLAGRDQGRKKSAREMAGKCKNGKKKFHQGRICYIRDKFVISARNCKFKSV